jgi:hypothetical protein
MGSHDTISASKILTSLFAIGAVEQLTDGRKGKRRGLIFVHLLNLAAMCAVALFPLNGSFDTKLVAHRCQPTPQQLRLRSSHQTEICYLVRNQWHPQVSVEGSVEAPLALPLTKVLHTQRRPGVTIYMVQYQQ